MELDDLDRTLVSHFAARFPKPPTLDFCDYDIAPSSVKEWCTQPRAYENQQLVRNFVSHNRWGMFGDWRDFPAFAGDVAVYCRRNSLLQENDLTFFFLHLSPPGSFGTLDRPVLRRWIDDILNPSNPLQRLGLFQWDVHALDYLALLGNLGGNINSAVSQSIAYALNAEDHVAPLCSALLTFLESDGQVAEERIERHFAEMPFSIDNQDPPTRDFIPASSVQAIITSLRDHANDLLALSLY